MKNYGKGQGANSIKSIFSTVELTREKSNNFKLDHAFDFSGKFGMLMPSLTMECIPGDRVQISCSQFMRMQALIFPVMHRMNVYTHYFFVPNRILWDGWEEYITQKATGGLPQLTVDGAWTADEQRLGDYLGLPPVSSVTAVGPRNVNALPFAAYQCIYNEYYRDQQLISAINYKLADGVQANGVFTTLRYRAFEHDYFTAARPDPQLGASAVDIPLGVVELDTGASGTPQWMAGAVQAAAGNIIQTGGIPTQIESSGQPGQKVAYDPDGTLNVAPTTITDLRRAFKLQEYLERLSVVGTRFTEWLYGIFGVKSDDARLQRPEYITGAKTPVVISEVLNTSGAFDPANPSTPGSRVQGDMAGHGVSVGYGYEGSFYCKEHGYIIGITSVLPRTMYSQGIPRHWLREDPLDFYIPQFANIGEQAIMNDEIYGYGGANGLLEWGYIPRYAEYKYMPSRIAGNFRDAGYDAWHLNREFGSLPTLSQDFVECDPDEFERIFAVQNGDDNLLFSVEHFIKANRMMPVFGTPRI